MAVPVCFAIDSYLSTYARMHDLASSHCLPAPLPRPRMECVTYVQLYLPFPLVPNRVAPCRTWSFLVVPCHWRGSLHVDCMPSCMPSCKLYSVPSPAPFPRSCSPKTESTSFCFQSGHLSNAHKVAHTPDPAFLSFLLRGLLPSVLTAHSVESALSWSTACAYDAYNAYV
jgi:hypothetical protein